MSKKGHQHSVEFKEYLTRKLQIALDKIMREGLRKQLDIELKRIYEDAESNEHYKNLPHGPLDDYGFKVIVEQKI